MSATFHALNFSNSDGATQCPQTRLERWELPALLGAAFLLRVTAIFMFPGLHHPDENFQFFEPAHRLAFGYGIQTWEFQDGARALVVPYALAGIFKLASQFIEGPEGYLFTARILLAGLSLIIVASAYRMGLRTSRAHALIVGIVAATWFEIVYFSFRPLAEGLATDFLMVALTTASRPEERVTRRHLIIIGFCLSISLMLRVQLIPGIAFLAVWMCGSDIRSRWIPMAAGGLGPVILFGGADWLTWGAPFYSIKQTVFINLFQGKASAYGTNTGYYYLQIIYTQWGLALPILAAFILKRLRPSNLWICFAIIVIGSHSFVPHKEYRFIFPAVACLVVVAAMGSADLLVKATEKMRPLPAGLLTAAVAVCWISTSAALSFAPGFVRNWTNGIGVVRASFWVSSQPEVCGVLFYDDEFWRTGGYAHVHRNVPLYVRIHARRIDPDFQKERVEPYNYVVLRRSSIADVEPGFDKAFCEGSGAPGDTCVIRRAGTCSRIPSLIPLSEQERLGEPPG